MGGEGAGASAESEGPGTRSVDVREQGKMDVPAREERELSLPVLIRSLQALRGLAGTHPVGEGRLLY